MKHKTSKSVSKRIRVTRTGKIMRRPMGVDHFKTKKSNKTSRRSRGTTTLNYPARKITNY